MMGIPVGNSLVAKGVVFPSTRIQFKGCLGFFRTRYWKGFVVETDSVRGGPFEEAQQPRNCSEGEGAHKCAKIPEEYTGMDPVPANMRKKGIRMAVSQSE